MNDKFVEGGKRRSDCAGEARLPANTGKCYCNCCHWPFMLINDNNEYDINSENHGNQNLDSITRNWRHKRRGRNKLQICHRKHKSFEYNRQQQQQINTNYSTTSTKHQLIAYYSLITIVISILFTGLLLTVEPTAGLDSPVKVQRFKVQQLASASGSNSSLNVAPTIALNKSFNQEIRDSSSLQLAQNSTNQASKVDRVRRTNQPTSLSQNNHTAQPQGNECPPTKLIQSLLPAEYQQQQQQSTNNNLQRAHCDCVRDLHGWFVTCYAGSANRNNLAASAALLPNQLHPAFRGPQLQRQQQQQAAAAAATNGVNGGAQRRVHRAARWMGDDVEETPANNLARSSDQNVVSHQPGSFQEDSSSVSHEGFGDEPTTVSGPQAEAAADSRHQRKAIGSPRSQTAAAAAANLSSPTDVDDSFVLSPSSNSFTLLQPTQQQQQQHGQENLEQNYRATTSNNNNNNNTNSSRSEKMIMMQHASNNNNNHQLMFQTVPILFSVKYIRNTIIEIDCDQAAPQYKPAMFQGKFGCDEEGERERERDN